MGPRQVDALIITALMDELEAVLAFGERGKDAWTAHKDPDGFPFHYRELPREDGGSPLRLAAASFDEMGEIAAATRALSLIIACGTWAPGKVSLLLSPSPKAGWPSPPWPLPLGRFPRRRLLERRRPLPLRTGRAGSLSPTPLRVPDAEPLFSLPR